jgi:hypothetical protein
MGTDFLVSEYSKFLRERSAQGEANHIASRLFDSFVPASEASCASFIWGTTADLGGGELLRVRHAPPIRPLQERGMLFVGTSVDRRDEWATLPRIRRVIRSSRQSGLATTRIPLSGIRQGHGFLG